MRICIPIPDRPRGGLYSFLTVLRQYLDNRGIAHTQDPGENYDVLFCNSFMVSYDEILAAKRRLSRVCVVQRVDGSAEDYGRGRSDDVSQARINMLADATIFQSEYGKFATTRKYRLMSREGPVIYNPVDTDAFSPEGPAEALPQALPGVLKIAHVTFSTNPRKGMAALYEAAAANPVVTFVLVGRYEDIPALDNLLPLGVADRLQLPRILRACDAFVTFSENETCPNVVLEALACGLPVLFLDSGGTAELVGNCGAAVTPTSFGEKLAMVRIRQGDLSAECRRRAVSHFAPDVILPRYIQAMQDARRHRVPTRGDIIWAYARGYRVLPFSRRELSRKALAWAMRTERKRKTGVSG